jgi:selenocysteine lyase/cysteine desulfurase
VDFQALRRSEFGRLDTGGHAYLDYTGTALYAASQIEAHHARLLTHVFGNPHSEHPAALASTERMERARARVLEFFHADPAEYDLIFTANASAALKIVGESFPFERGSRFLLTADNHNSVNGIRMFAVGAGAEVQYIPLDGTLRPVQPQRWLDGAVRSRPICLRTLRNRTTRARVILWPGHSRRAMRATGCYWMGPHTFRPVRSI